MIAPIGSRSAGESRVQMQSAANRLSDQPRIPDSCAESESPLRNLPSRLWVVAVVKGGQPLKIVSYSSERDEALGKFRREWDGSTTVQFPIAMRPSTLAVIADVAGEVAKERLAKDRAQAEADAALSPAQVTAQLEALVEQLRGVGLKKNRRGFAEKVVVYECKRPVRWLSLETGRKLMRLVIDYRKEVSMRAKREKRREDAKREQYRALKLADRGGDSLTHGESRRQFWPIDLLREWEHLFGG